MDDENLFTNKKELLGDYEDLYNHNLASAKKVLFDGIKSGKYQVGYGVWDSDKNKGGYAIKTCKDKLILARHDLAKYQHSDKEYLDGWNMQVRQVSPKEESLNIVVYMWKHADNCGFPFKEKESVYLELRNTPITGKIYMVDNDYYGGECLVLYIKSDKKSFLEWSES